MHRQHYMQCQGIDQEAFGTLGMTHLEHRTKPDTKTQSGRHLCLVYPHNVECGDSSSPSCSGRGPTAIDTHTPTHSINKLMVLW